MNRTERLAAITLLLLARRRVTAAEIARTFEISERTVYRDLDALGQGGLPLISQAGAGGGYELPADYRLMPLTLTPDEAIALWTALQAIGSRDHPMREAARGAWLRIQAALPQELRAHVVDVGAGVDVSRMLPDAQVPATVFATAVRALRERRQLRIWYHVPTTGHSTERTVDLYGLACVRGRWYAPAHCHLRGGLRSFRLDRVTARSS
ncbi:MAG: WYL domain-containing protein [Limnochordaceae bacterium]|nr:WYL domain-containing protein [Limnochordaceae bacterium]